MNEQNPLWQSNFISRELQGEIALAVAKTLGTVALVVFGYYIPDIWSYFRD